MKVVIAIDSLKGSLSSIEAGNAIKTGILNIGDADVVVKPLADGGEGTVQALVTGMDGTYREVEVTGPLGKKVLCKYGVLEESKTAIIEMSGAAGITLLPAHKKNPMNTTTYGVGEVIKDAIAYGCRNFIVGIGGSATNDGGIGMLQALGFDILDEEGKQVSYGAKGLDEIHTISDKNKLKELSECNFRIACDVNNPLCGPRGCSAVYGPQKGATPEMVTWMDEKLIDYSILVKGCLGADVAEVPGTGAAGGLGYAFLAFLQAKLEPGIEIILDEIGLEEEIKDADFVITGEGMLDFQTAMGKAPIGVAKLAKKYNKKVLAFAGAVTEDAKECNKQGIDAFFPILRRITTLEQAMDKETARTNLVDTTEQVFRIIRALY